MGGCKGGILLGEWWPGASRTRAGLQGVEDTGERYPGVLGGRERHQCGTAPREKVGAGPVDCVPRPGLLFPRGRTSAVGMVAEVTQVRDWGTGEG